jgi:hypothetical protein
MTSADFLQVVCGHCHEPTQLDEMLTHATDGMRSVCTRPECLRWRIGIEITERNAEIARLRTELEISAEAIRLIPEDRTYLLGEVERLKTALLAAADALNDAAEFALIIDGSPLGYGNARDAARKAAE